MKLSSPVLFRALGALALFLSTGCSWGTEAVLVEASFDAERGERLCSICNKDCLKSVAEAEEIIKMMKSVLAELARQEEDSPFKGDRFIFSIDRGEAGPQTPPVAVDFVDPVGGRESAGRYYKSDLQGVDLDAALQRLAEEFLKLGDKLGADPELKVRITLKTCSHQELIACPPQARIVNLGPCA